MTDHQCRKLLEATTQSCYAIEVSENAPTI
jgi:hypothetical protein